MLNASKKNTIVNSYANVLIDILRENNNYAEDLNTLSCILNNLEDFSNFDINPSMLTQYKQAVQNIRSNLNKDDKLSVFLEKILERKYVFLLKNIIDNVQNKLQKQLNNKKIEVFSCEELNDFFKKEIITLIEKQLGNVNIEFKLNKNIRKNNIDFIANGKICSLDLTQIAQKLLNI